jgi:hypothetical protein
MPDGSPITPHAFSYRFCRATRDEFRVPINVHFVRNIAATGISVFEPGLVAIIQEVLDHTNDDMRKQWYDLADRLSASRRYIELLGSRRQRAIENVLKGEGTT